MTVDDRSIMRWKGNATRQVRVKRRCPSASRQRLTQSKSRGGLSAILAAVLIAFLWQSIVTQTHRHFEPSAVSSASAAKVIGAGPGRTGRQSPSDLPSNCPVCREIATSGNIVLPALIEFEAQALVSFWLVVTSPLSPARAKRSHAWQSRAPPHQLQA